MRYNIHSIAATIIAGRGAERKESAPVNTRSAYHSFTKTRNTSEIYISADADTGTVDVRDLVGGCSVASTWAYNSVGARRWVYCIYIYIHQAHSYVVLVKGNRTRGLRISTGVRRRDAAAVSPYTRATQERTRENPS